jgi:REP element-mobilizing transposase RayT
MRECEEFCEVRILTFCILANHFHLLVQVPPRPQMPSERRGRLQEIPESIWPATPERGAAGARVGRGGGAVHGAGTAPQRLWLAGHRFGSDPGDVVRPSRRVIAR